MPKIAYKPNLLNARHLAIVNAANGFIRRYMAAGYRLTLRQLYYQFVAGGILPNRQRNYKWLGGIISEARLVGLIDWHAIEDRTRNLRSVGTRTDPREAMRRAWKDFRIDMWEHQPRRIEIWIEKEALAGVVERVAVANRVNYFSCRGYNSQSEMWGASQRLKGIILGGQSPTILHLGDFDPSGVDMTGDIRRRLEMFMGQYYGRLEIKRIALNMRQIEALRPPPNPAKLSDSRARKYIAKYGESSWELDALSPTRLGAYIQRAIDRRRDESRWGQDKARETTYRTQLRRAFKRWDDVVKFLDGD